MSNIKLTQKQKDLEIQISRYDTRIKQAYLGSIFTIQQDEYPDRLAHFAYSLRDVIDLLARCKQTEREQRKTLDKHKRKDLLQSVIDPLGRQPYAYDDEYERLVDEHTALSSIAHNKKAISDEQACTKLAIVEDILYTFTAPQTAIYEEIDEIVLKEPSAEDAKRLVRMQFRMATQFKLIEKLPEDWLPYMIDAEYFKDPQPGNWAPSKYLIKCSNSFPRDVTETIISCIFNDTKARNPATYADLLICALNLPTDCADRIGQKILNEQWYDFIENYRFAEKYVELTEKLYLNERYSIAIKLAYHAFAPKLHVRDLVQPPDNLINDDNVVPPGASYFFEEMLRDMIPKLRQKNPMLLIELITNLLDEYIKLNNQGKRIDKRYDDRSVIWRPTIEDSDQNGQPDIKSLLLIQLRDCLLYIGKDDVQKLKVAMHILHKKDYWIYRRLELYVYSHFSQAFECEIILSILWYTGNIYTHHEYYHLINSEFSTLPMYIKQRIFESIDKGYDPNKFERIKQKRGEKAAEGSEKNWKLVRFEPIKDELDEKHKPIYAKLVEELGVPEYPDYLRYVTTRIGEPASDHNLFIDKTIDQVFGIVKNHTTAKGLFAFDDVIVATFREYVENHPWECSKKSSELECADPTLQYALFSGLGHAVQKDKDIEWEGVLPLIEYVVSSELPDKSYASKFYDPVYAINSLMEDALNKNSICFQLKDIVWKVIKLLVEIGTRVHEQDDYPDSQTNSLDISKSNINGMSFHLVYQYAVWCEKHGSIKRVLVPEAKQVFDDYLNKKLGCHTVSRHAVLGVFFPNFYYLDKPWVNNILEKIHSGKNVWIAFWDAYVSWNRLYVYVFDDLYKLYDQFLNNGSLIQNREPKQPYYSTIDHVMLAYLYDLDYATGIVEKFLDKADELANNNAEDKFSIEHCVHQVGMIIGVKDGDPKFNTQKLIEMWKRPSVLQHNLDRWFSDSPLDKKTTVSLYLHYIKNYPKKFNLLYTPIGALQSYIEDFSREVVDCLEILLDKQANNYIPEEEIRDILKSLLKIGNEQINTKCMTIIEKVALLGHDWRDLLDV